MSPTFLADTWRRVRLFAVVTAPHPETTLPLARALFDGGIRGMEITFRTEEAAAAIRAVRDALPEMIVGAGTLLDPQQVEQAQAAGAQFGVAPGLQLSVVEAARGIGLPFAPGVATPSEVEQALSAGCRCLKLFPAEPLGGLPYLKAISAPYAHLDPVWLPLGGIDREKAAEYFTLPAVAAVGGSFLTPASRIEQRDWAGLTTIARESLEALA